MQDVKEEYKSATQQKAGSISITYFTDPLCCWSWAFENQWQQLIAAFKSFITWRYCLCGLLPDWNNYHDAINSVSKPLQMGPMWMHAAAVTGVFIQHNLWVKDPPASSFPACIAVKAAALQSQEAGEKYLYLVRRACMQDGKNIARLDVLTDIAHHLAKSTNMQFDVTQFEQQLVSDKSKEAFRKDLQEVKYYGINRFPSLVINNGGNTAKLITGYQSYETIADVLNNLIIHPLVNTSG